MTNKTGWEEEITDMLRDVGLKPIHFKLNNSGIRIINRIKQELADARREVIEKVEKCKKDLYSYQATTEKINSNATKHEKAWISSGFRLAVDSLDDLLAALRKEEE